MYGERNSVCSAETLFIYTCQSNPTDTLTHTHTYTLSAVPSSTSHTSKLDQHALGWLNIAEEVHCGLPLCEDVRDVIKMLGVINPSHSQTQHQNTTSVSQPRDRTSRNLLSHLFSLDDAKLTYHILPVCVAVTEFTRSQYGALGKKRHQILFVCMLYCFGT